MKNLIFIFITLPLALYSQNFSFVTDSDSAFVALQGISNKAFLTSGGYFYFNDVNQAYLHSKANISYYKDKFSELNIPLIEDYSVDNSPTESVIVVNRNNIPLESSEYSYDELKNYDELNKRILAFNRERSTGYTFQIIGIGVGAIGFATDEPIAAAGGALLQLIGLITVASAGAQLR